MTSQMKWKAYMKIFQLDDDTIKEKLKITDLENAFNVFIDKNLNRIFNLNESLYINADFSSLPVFQCNQEMHWPIVSYKIYGSTRLAWLLWKVNNVSADQTLKARKPGEVVRYLPVDLVQRIVSDINSFND